MARQAQQALERAASPEAPGVAVLIAQGDTVIFRGARGRAEIELGVPLSADHVFRIASVTKMFTAATILKLAELGKLSLDDSLAKYLPDFPNATGITLRELLSHTAGISDITKDPTPGFTRRDADTATLIAEIRKRPPSFAPGTGWAYSNAGFILLGAVIEKVTGEPWYDALQKQLLQPLGLKHTTYGGNALLIPGRTAGYTTDSSTHQVSNAKFISMTVPAAAGALVSTVDDLRLWMRALADGRAIGKQGLQQMTTPAPDLPGTPSAYRYGLGMYIWHIRGNTMVGHTGQIDGFAAVVAYLPKQDITVIALANDDNFDARSMGRRLAAIALGEPFPEVVAVPASDETLQALEGTYRIDENTIETLSVKDHTLYAQRGNKNVIPLQMTAGQQLHFIPDELSYFVPVRDTDGKIIRLDYFADGDGPAQALPRILKNSTAP
ncbi:serine hydrolase domain-containing protein [Dyella tabacisoli]|nr:serine hydrolase domain-containing protein [Dyella tabacisoli]